MGRAQAAGVRVHQPADPMETEVHLLHARRAGFQAHGLARKSPSDVAFPPAPAQGAAVADPALGPGARIRERRQGPAIGAAALPIERRRAALAQRLMGSPLVVAGHPTRGAPLLGARRGGGGGGDLGLLDPMHLFVRAVVLGPARAVPQPRPPRPPKTAQPFETGFAAQAGRPAQLGHRVPAA